MKVQQFLEHHGLARNPFSEEDAQTDRVFQDHCMDSTHHPTWDKVVGTPGTPATSVVFGEKGAGKTALQLQVESEIRQFNRQHPQDRMFVVRYDDWNPFLDRFQERMGRNRKPDRVLGSWQLWDHMDAILSLGVTQLVDQLLNEHRDGGMTPVARQDWIRGLDRFQRRDVLLLAACYDRSTDQSYGQRWGRLRRLLRYWSLSTVWPLALGWSVTLLVVAAAIASLQVTLPGWLTSVRPAVWVTLALVVTVGAWLPYAIRRIKSTYRALQTARHLRTVPRAIWPLARLLMRFPATEIDEQPLPNKDRTDDRYELLNKLQGVLRTLHYGGIVVLVDRVDEPHLINGSAERMRTLVWPLLDNKFLKHPGLGIKLMLPAELIPFVDQEGRDFHQRARLDKQNVVPSLEWTGQALQDVANARLAACTSNGTQPKLQDLFDPSVTNQRLLDVLRGLRVPRHLFKFLHRLLVAHCNAYTDEEPAWRISGPLLESILAVYQREQDVAERRVR